MILKMAADLDAAERALEATARIAAADRERVCELVDENQDLADRLEAALADVARLADQLAEVLTALPAGATVRAGEAVFTRSAGVTVADGEFINSEGRRVDAEDVIAAAAGGGLEVCLG